MGLGVVWLNGMVWALTQLVAEATREEGCLEPSLHPHRWVHKTCSIVILTIVPGCRHGLR